MKFKVGDRVKHFNATWKGTVLSVFNSDVWVHVDGDDGALTYEARNLLRLKPKVKREPRKVWANTYMSISGGLDYCIYPSKESADKSAASGRIECVEFVEVIKK